MAFNFGGQPGQPTSSFGFTPATQAQAAGLQFGSATPSFGLGVGTQPPATTTSTFNFGGGTGNMTFGTPVSGSSASVFGAPTATSTSANMFGFGATGAGGSTGFTFGQTAPTGLSNTPAFGTSGGSIFGAPPAVTSMTTPAATSMTTPFFSSGGSFSFSGAPTTTPQFGAPLATATTSQPFNFSAPPTTTTPSLFGGAGFTLGSSAQQSTVAPSLLSGGGTLFSGFGTTNSSVFQPSSSVAGILTTNTTAPSTAAPTPFGGQPTTLTLDSSTTQGTAFGAAVSSAALPSLFGPPSSVSVAPTIKPTIPPSTGFGTLPSFVSSTPATTTPTIGITTPNVTQASTRISLTGFTSTTTSVPGSGTVTSSATPTFGNTLFAPKVTPQVGVAGTPTPLGPVVPTTTTTTTTIAPATSLAAAATTIITTSLPPTFSVGLASMLTSTPTTTTATVTDSAAPGTQMSFRQLEEAINKWNLELSDQERIFLNQATQVNAWDRLLINNGLKIKDLHESVERVKLEQERLDHELDFIVSQQRELEDLLTPLEKALDDTPALSIQQHADLQREHTYHLAEKVDCQLKRMAEDIRQIIEHLNTSQNQDDADPMQQVSKILNAHMDALQWVDQNTELLQKRLEEISKVMETTRKDSESSWRFSYN